MTSFARVQRKNLTAALGFLTLKPTEPELRLLHRAFGLIAVGMARQGFRLSLSHIAEEEWRCAFMRNNRMLAPAGYGGATTRRGAPSRWRGRRW